MNRGIFVLLALPFCAFSAETPLRLEEALKLAVSQSKAAQISKLKAEEASASLDRARRERYPILSVIGTSAYTPSPYRVELAQGSLSPMLDAVGTRLGMGPLTPTTGPFPSENTTLLKGNRSINLGGLSLIQPISQQWRIGSGIDAARAEQEAARLEEAKITAQLRYSVEELFAAILVENRKFAALEAKLGYQKAQLQDAEHARTVGELLDDAVLGLQAECAQTEAALTGSNQQRTTLGLQLADLIGRPGEAQLAVEETLPDRREFPLDHWLACVSRNPDRAVAAAVVRKAEAGVRASRQANIPDIALFAAGFEQSGIELMSDSNAIVGVMLKWDIVDFGRRSADTRKSLLQRRQAELNRDRIEEEASRQVRITYREMAYADDLIRLADKAAGYRRRAAQIAHQSLDNGLALPSKALSADADLRQAEADLFAARTKRHLALLRLYWLGGEL